MLPVYKTVVANTNIANLSFNQAPDIILKAAFDPGWGHYELFGIGGFAHETVYPGVTTNSTLYGGVTDISHRPGTCRGFRLQPALSPTASRLAASVAACAFLDCQQAHLRRQRPLWSRHGSLRRYDTRRCYRRRQWKARAHPQPQRPVHRRGHSHAAHDHLPQLRRRLCRAYRLRQRQRHHAQHASKPVFCPIGATGSACTNAPTAAQVAAGGAWGAQYTLQQPR